MAKKTVIFNQSAVAKLPDNKPVLYKIKTKSGNINYVGTAQRARVKERIQEHLADGRIPGAKIQIKQFSSIKQARQEEQNTISIIKPKYNKQGK